jgi:tripartite-type tricarboxylate transporter receptor subunit TctC
MIVRKLVLTTFAMIVSSLAAADEIADFYRGKELQIIIRANPGGNYDTYSRLLGRHIVKHIPGNPTAVPRNMPGGGGLTALNYVTNVAPKDGTVLTMVTASMPMDQALGRNKRLTTDMRKLNWLGNMSDENLFLVTTSKSPAKTLDDVKRRETAMAATGSGGVESIVVALLNNTLGTKFKNIYGYRSSPEMNLSMERGETEGRMTTNLRALYAAAATRPGSKGAADYNVILQIGMEKAKEYPNVPLLRELAQGADDKLVFDFLSRSVSLARPIATNQDVPPARVAALRKAFDATMKDPEFLADAKKMQLDITETNGADLQAAVAAIVDTPRPVLDRIAEALATGAPSAERPKPAKK